MAFCISLIRGMMVPGAMKVVELMGRGLVAYLATTVRALLGVILIRNGVRLCRKHQQVGLPQGL